MSRSERISVLSAVWISASPCAVVSTMVKPACRTAVTMQAPGWPAISNGETMMVLPIARERPTLARVNASRRLTAAVRS